MDFSTGDLVYVTDFPGHIAVVQGSAACEAHPDAYDHVEHLVLNPMGEETWVCEEDLEPVE